MECVIKRCNRKAVKTALCSSHYEKRRTGDYSIDIKNSFTGTFKESLDYYSKKMPNGCIEWTGNITNSGYGRISSGGKRLLAHRVAYELRHGPIEMAQDIHHKCNNPKCVNADHLEKMRPHNHINELKRDDKGKLIAHSHV